MGNVKARYQYWPMGPRTWPVRQDRRGRFTARVSDVDFTVTGSVFVPITKVACGPRETAIFTWLVVVTVIVWCPLWILVVLRCAWNRRVSFHWDIGDVGTQHASLMWSYCNGLGFSARYQSSLWAQRNSHITWPVASCGNGRCLMPVTNMCYQ
jgi:hypothetical protein